MSILSTNHRLISIGESYSAGNGIDITDQVISVTGDATPYSAGENIDIQDHIISGKDWSNDITEASSHAYNETTAWVKENYTNSADMTYISAVVDTKLDASAWSSVSGDLATESYVIMSDNITYDRAKGYVDSKGYATEEFVNENTSGKLDSTAFTNWQNGQYSTDLQTIENQIENKYDTSSFAGVSSDFLTNEDLGNYYTKSETSGKEELANAFANIPAGDTEVNTYVQNNSATINEVNTTYQSNSSNYITAHQSLDGYATTAWVNEQGYLKEVSIPESAVWQDVSTTVQTNSAQWGQGGGAISSYTTVWSPDVPPPYSDQVINSLNEKFISAFISNFADKSNFANNANSSNSAGYAQEVNETYVENKGFARNLSSEYGTVSVIHNNIIESTNSAIVRTGNEGFVSSFEGQAIGPEVNGIATYSWDKAFPNTIINLNMGWTNSQILTYSANTNLTGEIVLPMGENTQTINIPNATEFKVSSNNWVNVNNVVVSADGQFETFVGELAWASALPTYEYDNTNKISAINGSAICGGEFPSGTMNVSGLEYNAVNEISAYNGSAIAQYGSEKQWLQHDDTLVHVSNSAQYALGVNLSAVAQLLGVDETVLYSNFTGRPVTIGSYIDLSESPLNFTEIAIYLNGSSPITINMANGYERVPAEQLSSTNSLEFVKEFVGTVGNTGSVHDMGCGYSGTSGTRWTKWYGYAYNVQNKNTNFDNNIHLNIWKVIGIGRKA